MGIKGNTEEMNSTVLAETYPKLTMRVGVCQSVGQRYDHNEDSIYVMNSLLSSDKNMFPFGLFIVCDGMGGHEKGEEASSLAVNVMSEHIIRSLYLPMVNPHGFSQPEPIQEVIESGLNLINKQLVANVPEGGTTMTAVVVMGNYLTLGHVGDSRAYLLSSGGKLEQISKDQTLVQRLVDLGQLTEEEGKSYPRRNVLYSALGQSETLETQIITKKIPDEGFIFLCSDGITTCVGDDTIKTIILDAKDPQNACEKLINAANEAGGPDNISAIVVQIIP
jgi:serine/threonine protein phosphatase PrpC